MQSRQRTLLVGALAVAVFSAGSGPAGAAAGENEKA